MEPTSNKVNKNRVYCVRCGNFISYGSVVKGTARYYFEHDENDKLKEEWTCEDCVKEVLA